MNDRVALFRAGVAGLGLMRLSPAGSLEDIAIAIEALRSCLQDVAQGPVDSLPEVDAATGYREWAETYDLPGNPLISLEEPVVATLLDRLPVGDAVDVAAGTGRYARRLAALGHRVTAVDASPQMLGRVVGADGVRGVVGDMTRLPLTDGSADAAVCSLALTHVPRLERAIGEIARILRRTGRAVISDVHPLVAATGGMAFYRTVSGEERFVRNHVLWPSDYLAAFARSGLEVRECIEPRFGPASGVPYLMRGPTGAVDAAARTAFAGLPGAIVWMVERPS